MFCLTIAGQPAKKIFQIYRNALHKDYDIPAVQYAMARFNERRKYFLLNIPAIRKNQYLHRSNTEGESLETAICGFRAGKDGVV